MRRILIFVIFFVTLTVRDPSAAALFNTTDKGSANSPPVLSKTFINQEAKRRKLQGRNVSAREKDLMHRAYIAGVHAAKFRKKSRTHRGSGSGARPSFLMGSPTLPGPVLAGGIMQLPTPTRGPNSNADGTAGAGSGAPSFDDEAFDSLLGNLGADL